MSITSFPLPDLGEGLREARIVQWHVSAGEHVRAEQPLVSVENDKAVVEIPAPRSGVLARLCAGPGDRVAVGAPLVEYAAEDSPDSGAIVGDLPGTSGKEPASGSSPAPAEAAVPGGRRDKAKTSPHVRRLARERGVDLDMLTPTGPHGTVTREDVVQAAGDGGAPRLPLSGVRRAMAGRMRDAGSRVVPATVTDWADVEAWPAACEPMPRLVRAVVRACAAEPALNVWYDDTAETRQMHERVDLGVAVDTADGLFVPVLRDALALTPEELSRDLRRLVTSVRERTAAPDRFHGPTITLSNFGTLGGRFASLVVLPPQVAIVGAGRMERRVVAGPEGPDTRLCLPLSLTFDHRVVTGGEAARFLRAVVEDLELRG